MTRKQKNCRLCHSKEVDLVHRGVRYGPETEVLKCKNCGIVFLDPFPTQEEMDDYYEEEYRREYGGTSTDVEKYPAYIAKARERLCRIERIIEPKSLLVEIGCGTGAFLDVARRRVDRVIGVELDDEMRVRIRRRLGVHTVARLADADIPPESVDIITLFHVLEHISDPESYLCELYKFLKPEGNLIIEVPNVDDALVKVYRIPAYLNFYFQKAHLYYFSKGALLSLFEKTGFRATVEGIQCYDLSNHIYWMLEGKPGGSGYFRNIFSPSLEKVYAETLIQSGHADTIWAVASKNSDRIVSRQPQT